MSRSHMRWYVVTMVFLAFDVEMVFLYPWAVVVASVGTKAVVEMFAFLEAELHRRGGRPVQSPAAAILVVCGRPGADLTAAMDTIWEDVPGPRSLVRLDETSSAADDQS